MKYKEIRKNYQVSDKYTLTLVDYLSLAVSPFLTKLFIKTSITPNRVTLLMILSGIVGAALFSVNLVWIKIIGIIFIYLWYILDCSDGEVARIKKRFSRYGKDIDYLAHFINHPLYIISFFMSFVQAGTYDSAIVAGLFMGILALEMINRGVMTLILADQQRSQSQASAQSEHSVIHKCIVYVLRIFTAFPNFAMIFPVVFLLNINIAFFLVIIQLIGAIIPILWATVKWTKTAIRS